MTEREATLQELFAEVYGRATRLYRKVLDDRERIPDRNTAYWLALEFDAIAKAAAKGVLVCSGVVELEAEIVPMLARGVVEGEKDG